MNPTRPSSIHNWPLMGPFLYRPNTVVYCWSRFAIMVVYCTIHGIASPFLIFWLSYLLDISSTMVSEPWKGVFLCHQGYNFYNIPRKVGFGSNRNLGFAITNIWKQGDSFEINSDTGCRSFMMHVVGVKTARKWFLKKILGMAQKAMRKSTEKLFTCLRKYRSLIIIIKTLAGRWKIEAFLRNSHAEMEKRLTWL